MPTPNGSVECCLIMADNYSNFLGFNKITMGCPMLFLAHLSQRLIWWAYRIGRPLSSIRPSPTLFEHFSWETTEPIEAKFHMEFPWDVGTKICSNGSGHMTKMAAMPIYGKKPLKIFKADDLKTCFAASGARVLPNFVQMMTLSWHWPILRQGQIWSLLLLYGKKVKQWIFQKLLSSMIWN